MGLVVTELRRCPPTILLVLGQVLTLPWWWQSLEGVPYTGDPRPTKQNSSISTYVWLFPLMNHCGKKTTCGFNQIHLSKTIDIHKWECPHECGKNHMIDQMRQWSNNVI